MRTTSSEHNNLVAVAPSLPHKNNKNFILKKLPNTVDINIDTISFVNGVITEFRKIYLISQEYSSHTREFSFLCEGGSRDTISASGNHQTAEELLEKFLKDQSAEQPYLILSLSTCIDANEIPYGHSAARCCQHRGDSCSES